MSRRRQGSAGAGQAALALLLALAGCHDHQESTGFGVDQRDLTVPIQNQDPQVYRGRVLNGNLQDAVVWLDLEEDGALSQGDPWAMSNSEGEFELDISGLQRDPAEARDLDPRDFPLMAVAVPGLTVDHHSGEAIDRAFFLLAPPDRVLISPFSTLVEIRRRLSFIPKPSSASEALEKSGADVRRRVAVAEEEISLLQDYQLSDSPRAPFYAEALRRFFQAQVPDDISDAVEGGDPPGVNVFSPQQMRVIGSLGLDQIGRILAEVDALINAIGVESFVLPPPGELETVGPLDPDLEDPLLLRRQSLRLPREGGARLELGKDEGHLAALVTPEYDTATRVRRLDVRGASRHSAGVLGPLMEQGGRIADLGRQPWLDLSLVPVAEEGSEADSLPLLEQFLDEATAPDGGIPWEDFRVDLDSALLNEATGERDGLADRHYRRPDGEASLDDQGRLRRLERILPQEGDGQSRELLWQVDYDSDTLAPLQSLNWPVALADQGMLSVTVGEVVHFDQLEGCENPENPDRPLVVNARQRLTLSTEEPAISGTLTRYGHLRDAPFGEVPAFRVLLEEFVLDNNGNHNGNERRELAYFDDDNGLLSERQPDLLASVRGFLDRAPVRDDRFCGGDGDGNGARILESEDLDWLLQFDYLRFSDYLEQSGSFNR
ncbi:MAG: hypothetical protein R3296_03340 [Oleiphilaceae bacterium]|nr:hypothetical protein [Oleiphilaceae bacterium]